VVGAGLLGLSTAWALRQRGVEVLVLEAATPGHPLAGSRGDARIFRLGYPDPLYVEMATLSFPLWRQLEAESGLALLEMTGQLTFGDELEAIAATLEGVGLPAEWLTPSGRAARFGAFEIVGPALFEPTSGVLAADRCLAALAAGAEIRTNTTVLALLDEGDQVRVLLADGSELVAEVVVNCAGHHAVALLADTRCPSARPPTLQQVAYFELTSDLPIFIEWGPQMLYGLPVPGQRRYKVAQHVPADPFDDDGGPMTDQPELLAVLTGAVERLLPGLDPTPVATERCLYDNTVDTDFIIDRVGQIVIGCGTSGHGFKFGPFMGQLLADLATRVDPPLDLSRFAATRSFLRALPDL
jgi:sarcosine oxidase